jgi:hypothetical protein
MEITRTVREWTIGESRIRWSAVFAGFVVGVSVQIVLTLLGLAIGAWSIDLHESQPAEGIPLGTGIWTGLSMLISAFTGGYVTSRLSGAPLRSDGMYQAAVVWGVTWLVFTWLTTTAMATMIGGLFSAFGSGLQSIGQAAGQGVSTTVSKAMDKTAANTNVTSEGLRKQIESILQATHKPELQSGEMKKDAGTVTDKAKGGQSLSQVTEAGVSELKEKLAALDQEAAINVMVNKLGMSKTQAQEVVQSSIGMIEPLKGKAQDVKERSVAMADTTIKNLASVAWWMFVLAMLSLGATLGGGALGIHQDFRMEVEGRLSLKPAHAGV